MSKKRLLICNSKVPLISDSNVPDGLDSLSGPPSITSRRNNLHHTQNQVKPVSCVVPANSGRDLRHKLKRPKLQSSHDVGNRVCRFDARKNRGRRLQKEPARKKVTRNNVAPPNRKRYTQDYDHYSPNSVLNERPILLQSPTSTQPPPHVLSSALAPFHDIPVPKVKYLPNFKLRPSSKVAGPSTSSSISRSSPNGQSLHHSGKRTDNENFKLQLKSPLTSIPNVLDNTNIKCFDPADESHFPSVESSPPKQVPGFVPGQYWSEQPGSSHSSLGATSLHQPTPGPSSFYPHELHNTPSPHLPTPQSDMTQYLSQNLSCVRETPQDPPQDHLGLERYHTETPSDYIDEIQRPVSTQLFEGIIGKTLDPALLIKCIKALAEIKETLPLPGRGMVSVTDKMTVFMALNDVLRLLHQNYSEQNQYKNTTVVNCNRSLPVGTFRRSKHEFVKEKAVEILSFLTNSEDVSKLDDIDLTYNDAVDGVPEGLEWLYSLDPNSLWVDPETVASAVQHEQSETKAKGLFEPDIDVVFDDPKFS